MTDYASSVPPFAERLMQAFWPGPLTVILPRREEIAAAAAGGQNSIGLRCPSHPMALAFLKACLKLGISGVAGPSANRFGRVSSTTAQHVIQEFGDELLVLDGGPCAVGIESSIVDCAQGRPVLLRPGVLTRARSWWRRAASRCLILMSCWSRAVRCATRFRHAGVALRA